MTFAPEYLSYVLADHFVHARTHYLTPLLTIHRAHLIMLARQGIVSREEAAGLRDGLDALREPEIAAAGFDGSCEDLFFHVERLLAAQCGDEMAGRLHTARSRNDIDMTMYRMEQRKLILGTIDGSVELRGALVALADRHRATLLPLHTHTQPAQPGTVGHYLLAVVEQLERDVVRLEAAYATTNRCPLGACAITGTGFPIDRQLTSDLLGFAAPTGNTYGSIATVDYLLESLSAVAVMMAGLGRVVQDLLLWSMVEFGYLRLPDGFVQASSIMPQKRNPVALEHARAMASRALGQVAAILLTVHNTPFGDIVDTEDDLQPQACGVFGDASRVTRLLAAALAGAEFDVERMATRASGGWITLTELADTLVREDHLPFRTAHAVAARVMTARDAQPAVTLAETLANVSREILGKALRYDEVTLQDLLSPRRFVAVRSTPGGPAPAQVASALEASLGRLDADRRWLAEERGRLAKAARRLQQESRVL
jgi:argininosuccinate lyase